MTRFSLAQFSAPFCLFFLVGCQNAQEIPKDGAFIHNGSLVYPNVNQALGPFLPETKLLEPRRVHFHKAKLEQVAEELPNPTETVFDTLKTEYRSEAEHLVEHLENKIAEAKATDPSGYDMFGGIDQTPPKPFKIKSVKACPDNQLSQIEITDEAFLQTVSDQIANRYKTLEQIDRGRLVVCIDDVKWVQVENHTRKIAPAFETRVDAFIQLVNERRGRKSVGLKAVFLSDDDKRKRPLFKKRVILDENKPKVVIEKETLSFADVKKQFIETYLASKATFPNELDPREMKETDESVAKEVSDYLAGKAEDLKNRLLDEYKAGNGEMKLLVERLSGAKALLIAMTELESPELLLADSLEKNKLINLFDRDKFQCYVDKKCDLLSLAHPEFVKKSSL